MLDLINQTFTIERIKLMDPLPHKYLFPIIPLLSNVDMIRKKLISWPIFQTINLSFQELSDCNHLLKFVKSSSFDCFKAHNNQQSSLKQINSSKPERSFYETIKIKRANNLEVSKSSAAREWLSQLKLRYWKIAINCKISFEIKFSNARSWKAKQ